MVRTRARAKLGYGTHGKEFYSYLRLRRVCTMLAAVLLISLLGSCGLPIGSGRAPLQPASTEPDTATPMPSGWLRFSNDKYGFRFEYPGSCAISELDGSFYVGGRIALTILDAQGSGLSDYVSRFVDEKVQNGSWRVESTKRGSIAGREAITVDYRFGGQGRYGTATFTLRNSDVFVWGLTAGGFSCDESEVYSTVLESFRFEGQ